LFKFKILVLMVARGHPEDKAEALLDLVTGSTDDESVEHQILWSNRRMQMAFEFMIYVSVLLPKIFYSQNKDNVNQLTLKQNLSKPLTYGAGPPVARDPAGFGDAEVKEDIYIF
jgi:hypothetical protein